MHKSICFIIYISAMLMSFTNLTDKFSWLEGTWEMKKSGGNSNLEVWKKIDDSTMIGAGMKVRGSDTTMLESIELVFRDNQYWYIPTVPDQNNATPVPFRLITSDEFKFTFENAKHDFPQRIVYHLKPVKKDFNITCTTGDTLFVRVESLEGQGMDYNFVRK